MRTGKIARLPSQLREQVNLALCNGVPAVKLVHWLNSLPEVQYMLAEHFGSRPINQPNMTEWARGGYSDWLFHQELLEKAASFYAQSRKPQNPENPRKTAPALAPII